MCGYHKSSYTALLWGERSGKLLLVCMKWNTQKHSSEATSTQPHAQNEPEPVEHVIKTTHTHTHTSNSHTHTQATHIHTNKQLTRYKHTRACLSCVYLLASFWNVKLKYQQPVLLCVFRWSLTIVLNWPLRRLRELKCILRHVKTDYLHSAATFIVEYTKMSSSSYLRPLCIGRCKATCCWLFE